jgi:hypothetical protein
MTSDEVRKILESHIGQRVRIVYDDGFTESVQVGSVDDEGFLHSGPGDDPQDFWTRFDSVMSVTVIDS